MAFSNAFDMREHNSVSLNGSIIAPVNAGTYTVTVDIEESDGYLAVSELELGSYVINKVSYPGIKSADLSVLEGETEVSLPAIPEGASYGTPTADDVVAITDMSITGDKLTFTAPAGSAGKTSAITIPVTGAINYNDFDIVVAANFRTPQAIYYVVGSVNKTYGGDRFSNPLSEIAVDVDGVVTYASSNTSVVTVDSATGEVTIVGAGSATITATAAETATHAETTASYTVNVSRKALVFQAEDKSMKKGKSLPALTYKVTGLVNGDTLISAPTLSAATDGKVAGSFEISITGGMVQNSDSYEITYTNGTLTVTNPGGSGGSGGSGGADTPGGGSGGQNPGGNTGDEASTVIVTPPTPQQPNAPTRAEVEVAATVDNNGNATVSITEEVIAAAYNKALAEAQKSGKEQNGVAVVLRINTGSQPVTSFTINLPKTVQNSIAVKGLVSTEVLVPWNLAISFDAAAMQAINRQAQGDVKITVAQGTGNSLSSDSAQKAIGSRPALTLRLQGADGLEVQGLGAGSITVSMPYALGADDKAENVQAVFVDEKGRLVWLLDSVYYAEEQVLRFAASNAGTYGVGYKQTSTSFTDTAGHWANGDINYVASRGLLVGTANNTFSPDMAMTRGMFVTAIGRLANADVSGYRQSSFTDVKSGAYYLPYIEWASANKIIHGVGNGRFVPDQAITREQLAVIIGNYTQALGFKLPQVRAEVNFADSAKISGYAKGYVRQVQMAGLMNGKDGGRFDPQGTATRAELAAVLRRLEQLLASRELKQGWTRNARGQWMYYENDAPVTGVREIDDASYTFDGEGVTTDVPRNLHYCTYTVQAGGSLWLVAERLGCSLSELERLNNRNRFTLVHPGDALRVPEK